MSNPTMLNHPPNEAQAGKDSEDGVKVANTHSQTRRLPKVTFCCQEITDNNLNLKLENWHYAKIFLPKTYEVYHDPFSSSLLSKGMLNHHYLQEAKVAALRCLSDLLRYSDWDGEKVWKFRLKVSIRRNDGQGFVYARILDDEWWEIMNELVQENPDLVVVVDRYKDY
jgi:hypothetical protein